MMLGIPRKTEELISTIEVVQQLKKKREHLKNMLSQINKRKIALHLLLAHLKSSDYIVIFSDGQIFQGKDGSMEDVYDIEKDFDFKKFRIRNATPNLIVKAIKLEAELAKNTLDKWLEENKNTSEAEIQNIMDMWYLGKISLDEVKAFYNGNPIIRRRLSLYGKTFDSEFKILATCLDLES